MLDHEDSGGGVLAATERPRIMRRRASAIGANAARGLIVKQHADGWLVAIATTENVRAVAELVADIADSSATIGCIR